MKKNQKISVEQLQVGTFIRLPISWKDHPFLFSSFKIKDAAQIELIKGLGLKDVFFDPEKSDVEPVTSQNANIPKPDEQALNALKEQMISQKSAKIDEQQKLKRDLKKTEQQFNRSVSMMRSMVSKISSRPLNAVSEVKDLISNMTNMLLNSDNLALHLMGDAKNDEHIYHHSLNVAMLSMLTAKELGWSREEVEIIGIGGLFHDIGKLKVPSNILNKRLALTTPEQNFIKQHPLMGINLLKLADSFPDEARPLIANHHEFLDGSGYPQGLKADKLDKLSQLIAVVNEYDNLCNGTNQIKGKTPSIALGLLYKNYKSKLNTEYISKLIKILGVYPPGSIIELSSGQFAMVMSVNLQKLLCPNIVVYDQLVPKDLAPIISLQDEGLSIVRSLPAAALPEKVHKYLNPREKISVGIGQN
ncbi:MULTISPECIES: HD-GYP domain-containing protein [Shewanella]|uniref:HD-GYP domain-containing protein n=1 Tax=Shewanella psychromarinicola TaxID=2487742 RepID=A0A3N4DAG1_9GAMM|nr:HD-GYP domain-containing protein [Shewanella psychromarinicola]AZG35793.1 HD-GYP domain-containing protein [Shewanella psychromarinicola]MCL1083849.1 HD-GYP domain-containing protein [Shewanella psychromarinicola]RPA22689.1 HD-GYP domain-containing protein [Shewanella psychromarinicola]